jgi:DNA-binding response OmpR family regulator
MKKHILLVDGNISELDFFLDALRKLPGDDGFKCTFAATTVQAISMLKFLVPDFIFIGLNVEDRGGSELISFLTTKDQLKNTPICFYISQVNDGVYKMANDLGAICLTKTGSIDRLSSDLESLFKAGRRTSYQTVEYL